MLKQFLSTITKLLNRCSLLTKAVKKQNFFLFKFLLWNNFKLRNLENTYWVFPHIFFSSLTTFVSRRRVWRAFLQKGGPQGWKEESQGLPVARKFINNKERKNRLQRVGCDLLFSRPVVSDSLRPYGLQHARPPCPSQSLRVCPSSCPSASVMPSRHLIPRCPLILPSIFPSIRDFSSESAVLSGDQNIGHNWAHTKKKQKDYLKSEVGHDKGGKWPWRAGVQFLRQGYLHNPQGPLMDNRDWQLQVI